MVGAGALPAHCVHTSLRQNEQVSHCDDWVHRPPAGTGVSVGVTVGVSVGVAVGSVEHTPLNPAQLAVAVELQQASLPWPELEHSKLHAMGLTQLLAGRGIKKLSVHTQQSAHAAPGLRSKPSRTAVTPNKHRA